MSKISSSQVLFACLVVILAFVYFIYQYSFHLHTIRQKESSSSGNIITSIDSSQFTVKYSNKYKICAFTAIDKGAFLLPQWIDYHTIVGIDQFFLVNTCDDDQPKKLAWLSFYESLGLISQLDYAKHGQKDNCVDTSKKPLDYMNQIYLRAKSECEWIVPLNIDEYLNPGHEGSHPNLPSPTIIGMRKFRSMILNMDMAFMKTLLTNSTSSLYHLPMYSMSTHMHENHTISLLIDHYLYGQFSNEDKYLVRSDYIPTLESSVKSSLRKDTKLTLSTLFSGSTADGELTPLSAERSMCLTPATPLFIKHFHALSYEDYMRISTDKDKSKQKWLKFSFKRKCPLLHEASRRVMSRKMLEFFQKNYVNYCASKANSSISPDIRVANWLNAEAIIC